MRERDFVVLFLLLEIVHKLFIACLTNGLKWKSPTLSRKRNKKKEKKKKRGKKNPFLFHFLSDQTRAVARVKLDVCARIGLNSTHLL